MTPEEIAALPEVLTVEQFDALVLKSKAYDDGNAGSRDQVYRRAKRYAKKHAGVVYTQIDTDGGNAEGSEYDVVYVKGYQLCNRTGRWEVILQVVTKKCQKSEAEIRRKEDEEAIEARRREKE